MARSLWALMKALGVPHTRAIIFCSVQMRSHSLLCRCETRWASVVMLVVVGLLFFLLLATYLLCVSKHPDNIKDGVGTASIVITHVQV